MSVNHKQRHEDLERKAGLLDKLHPLVKTVAGLAERVELPQPAVPPVNCITNHQHRGINCNPWPCFDCHERWKPTEPHKGARHFGDDFRWRCGVCHDKYVGATP